MEVNFLPSIFLLLISILGAAALEEEDKYKRSLDAFHFLEEKRHFGECEKDGDECDAVFHKCCDELVCFWEDGYSVNKKGNCIVCAPEGEPCQRSGQCCSGLCDKGKHPFKFNGLCSKKRTSGPCYKTAQCQKDCMRKWYQVIGHCE